MPGSAQSMITTRGRSCTREFDRFLAVAGLAGHGDVRLVLQDAAKAAPHQDVVVHQ